MRSSGIAPAGADEAWRGGRDPRAAGGQDGGCAATGCDSTGSGSSGRRSASKTTPGPPGSTLRRFHESRSAGRTCCALSPGSTTASPTPRRSSRSTSGSPPTSARFGHPDGADPARFQLVAPYEADPRQWERLPWVDRYSGERYRISTTAQTGGPGVARVQTYRDVLEDFQHHPEAKSAGPDGQPCTRQTVGLLQRRRVRTVPELLAYVGKESNRLEEVEAGLEHDPDEVYTEYTDATRDPWRSLVLPVLKHIPAKRLVEETGLAMSTIKAARNGHTNPHGRNRQPWHVGAPRGTTRPTEVRQDGPRGGATQLTRQRMQPGTRSTGASGIPRRSSARSCRTCRECRSARWRKQRGSRSATVHWCGEGRRHRTRGTGRRSPPSGKRVNRDGVGRTELRLAHDRLGHPVHAHPTASTCSLR